MSTFNLFQSQLQIFDRPSMWPAVVSSNPRRTLHGNFVSVGLGFLNGIGSGTQCLHDAAIPVRTAAVHPCRKNGDDFQHITCHIVFDAGIAPCVDQDDFCAEMVAHRQNQPGAKAQQSILSGEHLAVHLTTANPLE